jgi:glyoxylase-like metal-dependent hydrolase (beta-lactamase superfamily II)
MTVNPYTLLLGGRTLAGRTSLHLLTDGVVKMDGGAIFGQVPKGQWQEWMSPDRRNRVRLGLNCLLVRAGDKNFLIDSGSGQKFSAEKRETYGIGNGQLLPALKNLGLTPQDIHGVVLTSLHFEHSGGSTRWDRSGGLVPTFPKAHYYVQAQAFEEAKAPNERGAEGYCLDDFMPLYERGQVELLDGDTLLAPGVMVRSTGGPCMGHQIAIITHGGERVAFLGDLAPTPFHLQLACIAATDRWPEDTLERKREILGEAIKDGWLLMFSHALSDQQRAGYLEDRNGRRHLRGIDI